MDGFLNTNEIILSDRQREIFDVIRKYNLERVFGNTTLKEGASENEIYDALHHPNNEKYWVDTLSILQQIKSSSGIQFEESTLRNELKLLKEHDYILSKKDSNIKTKEIFAIKTIDIENKLKLPEPSEIIDPIFKGKKISVVNPILNTTETI
jgi:hypothetical protein